MTETKRRITDWQFEDMGFEHCQFWPGFGCGATRFKHCATGCGSTAAEAIDSMLEDIAQRGDFDDVDLGDLEAQLLAHCELKSWPDDGYPDDDNDDNADHDDGDMDDDNEINYYVGIRFNL